MAMVHGQPNSENIQRVVTAPPSVVETAPIVVKNDLTTTLNSVYTTSSNSTGEIYVPINAIAANSDGQSASGADEGQQIIQQFQIQLPDQTSSTGLVDQIGGAGNQTQQIQIIQTDPNNPDQPQVITLYTWGGN